MVGKFRRIRAGMGWLLTLGGIGVTLMTTGFRLIGLGLTVLGLFLFVYQFRDELKRLRLGVVSEDKDKMYVPPSMELLWAIAVSLVAILVTGYVFFFSGPLSQTVVDSSEVSQLRRELAELREGHPYTIPKEDEGAFVDILLSVDQHNLEISHADDDEKAAALDTRLSDLMKSVGWKVGPLNSPFFTGHPAPGLIILVSREYGTSSPLAARLKAFLARPTINIEAQIMNFNSGDGGLHTLKIFVGPAPKSMKAIKK